MKGLRFFIKWILVTLLASLTACRDEADDVLQPGILDGYKSLTEQFDAIWHGINQNYVFWEIDTTDWDAVYTRYRPRFVELDKQETVPTAELQDLYEEICGSLIDHHMEIRLINLLADPEDEWPFVEVNPGRSEVMKRDGLHYYIPCENFQAYRDKLKEAGRITNDYEFIDENPDAEFQYLFTYVIDNDILYLRPSDCLVANQIIQRNQYEKAWKAYEVYCQYLRQLLFNPAIKSVILDLRCNGGGLTSDVLPLLGPLLTEDVHILDTKTKMGIGRLDYGEWISWQAEAITQRQIGKLVGWEDELPETDCIGDRQVVVITDYLSASMAEITATGAKAMPYITLIGERTYGGTGSVTNNNHVSFSGQFGDLNYEKASYFVNISTWMSRTPAGEYLEGKGVTPDITVPLDVNLLIDKHIDNQLEYAIDFLHDKK